LDVRKHDVGRTCRDDIQSLAVFFPGLDLAVGEFAPEAVGLDDEAASMLLGKCREPDLFRSPLPDEYVAALIRIRGPCSGEIPAYASSRKIKPVNVVAAKANLSSRSMPSLHIHLAF
jgi:hypothetical protein